MAVLVKPILWMSAQTGVFKALMTRKSGRFGTTAPVRNARFPVTARISIRGRLTNVYSHQLLAVGLDHAYRDGGSSLQT